MALTIVLGLTFLSLANYGNTYEFGGQLKPTIKPFSTLTNQQPNQADQFKSVFGYNSVPSKPFGSPFEPFKQSYQPYQPFKANYQPFGPYPGYPGSVAYPGFGGYHGPEAYRFNEPSNKPFGFQPFPAPTPPAFSQYKFGPTKKFNKNFPGLTDFNQPGKYFQEHQFGAYHGPEFSSAIVPAEHNIKQSRPKDTLLGKPIEFGLPKQTSFGFPSPPSFGYPVPNFPPVQPFVSTVPSVKSVPASLIPVNAVKIEQKFGGAEATTSVVPSSSAQDDSATVEVTSEPSVVTPAADIQTTSPAQEEVTSSVSSDTQAPIAEVTSGNEAPTVQDTTATPAQALNEPNDSSTVSAPAKSETVTAENKPATGSGAVNLPGLPIELQNTQFGSIPISDTSSLGQFGSFGFPYFGQSTGAPQPSIYFDVPGLSEEELKVFKAKIASELSQSGLVLGSAANPEVKNILQGTSISNPSAEIATLIESGNKAKSQDKAVSDAKQITTDSPLLLPNTPNAQSKFNSVQIIQNDPFNGQLPLLYDPSNAASPLDTYKFYNHPSVSTWSSKASLASYSPESAFSNFGSLNQGYLVEGSPTLTPLAKTVVQSDQTPLSISSPDHPLHSQVFKYSQSFVPYPGLVAGNNNAAAAFQPTDVSSSTTTPAAAADVSVQSTSTPEVTVESSSSSAPAEKST